MQKPRFMGGCEPPVQWSLQGKKCLHGTERLWRSACGTFEILGAKRDKLLAPQSSATACGGCAQIIHNLQAFWRQDKRIALKYSKSPRIFSNERGF
jgi:hypothetical protein